MHKELEASHSEKSPGQTGRMAGRLAPGFCEWRMFIAITGGEPNKEQHSPLLLTAKSNGWWQSRPLLHRRLKNSHLHLHHHQLTLGSPTEYLKGVVGKRVIVRLTSGVDYRGAVASLGLAMVFIDFFFTTAGVLSCLDGYMNIALEQTEEHANGRVTNRYGGCFYPREQRCVSVLFAGCAFLICW